MIDYEKRIEEIKLIRRVYDFVTTYGIFEVDYEGVVDKLGDTVMMWKTRTPLIVDMRIPTFIDEKDLYRFLIANLDWQAGGNLVITIDRNRGMIYGYDKA